jgi:hypothetical protein
LILAVRGLAAALAAISPAPFRGVLPLPMRAFIRLPSEHLQSFYIVQRVFGVCPNPCSQKPDCAGIILAVWALHADGPHGTPKE